MYVYKYVHMYGYTCICIYVSVFSSPDKGELFKFSVASRNFMAEGLLLNCFQFSL